METHKISKNLMSFAIDITTLDKINKSNSFFEKVIEENNIFNLPTSEIKFYKQNAISRFSLFLNDYRLNIVKLSFGADDSYEVSVINIITQKFDYGLFNYTNKYKCRDEINIINKEEISFYINNFFNWQNQSYNFSFINEYFLLNKYRRIVC